MRKKSLLNKDVIITFFTQDRGKIKVFAKGIKKITSRRLPHLQSGNLIQGLFSKKGDRIYLQETKLISHFSGLKKDRKKTLCLYFMLFILDRMLPEGQKEEAVYMNFIKFIIELSKAKKNYQKLLEKHINEMLRFFGYTTKELPLSDLKETIEEIINEKIPAFII